MQWFLFLRPYVFTKFIDKFFILLIHEVFFYGHKIKSIVFGHTHKKMVLKIFNHFFINFLFTIKKIFLFMCVTKHFLFGHVTILEFLFIHLQHWRPSNHNFPCVLYSVYIIVVVINMYLFNFSTCFTLCMTNITTTIRRRNGMSLRIEIIYIYSCKAFVLKG
jgi:hypothetical protein